MSEYPLPDSFNVLLRFISPYDAPEAGEAVYLNFGDAISSSNADLPISTEESCIAVLETDFPLQKSEDILLRFVIPYDPPANWQDLTLSFGVVGDLEIVSRTLEIRIDALAHTVDPLTIIINDLAGISQDVNQHEVEIIVEIDNALAHIRIECLSHTVEHLPDIVPAAAEIKISCVGSVTEGGQPNNLPTGLSTGGLRHGWKQAQNHVSHDFNFPWSEPGDRKVKAGTPWGTPENRSKQTRSCFDVEMDRQDLQSDMPWKQFENQSDRHTRSPHIGIMTFVDELEMASWDTFKLSEKNTVNSYTNTQGVEGDYKDIHKRKLWGKAQEYNHHKRNDFRNDRPGAITDKHHSVYWGPYWYSLWCQEKYFPYGSGEEVQLVLKTDVPVMANPDFVQPKNARCPFTYWYSGGRDGFTPIITPSDQLFTERKKVYYMLNSAFIKRLSDNADIHFQSVQMSIDRNSWSWDFSVTLMTREALELIWPVGDTLIDIEININGWKWTCRVENWSESVAFGQRAWTVSGRSPSVELGEPYLVESSFINDEEHGGQIIDTILENTGWSATWPADDFDPYTDWLVPASTMSLYDSSKIQQMQTIVQAVGAFIQTAPNTNTSQEFTIKPTYKANPWNWGTQITPTVFLNDDICHEYGRSNNIIKPVNSVIVSGDTAGVIVSATKDGTAGDSPAPMVIDSLMTSQEAATERARHVLGESGFWINHSMRLFSLLPPGEAPGLILPGTFINMSETGFSAWIGQTTGTQVSAAWTDGLEVSQQIEVEQFYG